MTRQRQGTPRVTGKPTRPPSGDIACKGRDTNLWFPVDEDNSLQAEVAKDICRHCPAQIECGEFAIRRNVSDGIFGAMSSRDRRILVRRRNERRRKA